MRNDDVRTRLVIPFHPMRSKRKVDAIKKNMDAHGWQGRQLLVFEIGEEYQALTGSHRLHAAMRTLEKVPVLIIQERDLTSEQWEEFLQVRDQDALRFVLSNFVEDGAPVKEALDLVELEYREELDY